MNVNALCHGSCRANGILAPKKSPGTQNASADFQKTFNGIHTLVMGGLSSRGLSDGGCVTVYKAEGYRSENPIMRVVTRAADGREYEQFIDPAKVNPASATENEMSALTAYLIEEKKLDSADALGAGAGAAKGTASVSDVSTEKKNFYALTEEMMEMQYDAHNFASYVLYKKMLSVFDQYQSADRRAVRGKGPLSNVSISDLGAQASADLKAAENDKYDVSLHDQEGVKGYWRIYNKETGKTIGFDPKRTSMQIDPQTGKKYLVESDGYGGFMGAWGVDPSLEDLLKDFMGVEELRCTDINENYTLDRNAATGIVSIKKKGSEGNGGSLILESEEQEKKLEELADIYLEKYPSVITSKSMALTYAKLEVLGYAVRDDAGILTIGIGGMTYMNHQQPEQSWGILYSANDHSIYSKIKEAFASGAITGNLAGDCEKWAEWLTGKQIDFELATAEEDLERLQKDLYSVQISSQKDAARQLELPMETDRYVIRDASGMEGVSAYFIGDRETGKSVYIREDQLVIQRDGKTGFEFVINMEQPFCENVRVTDELKSILRTIADQRNFSLEETPLQGGLTVNQDPKTGLRYLSISGNEAKGVSVIITSEDDREIIERLADEFQQYPCASQRSTALLDALLEISGNLRRGTEGFTYLTPIGIGYVPYVGKGTGKAWLIQMPGSQYAAARRHLAMGGHENGDGSQWMRLIKNGHIIYEDADGLHSYRTEGLEFGYMYH